MKNNTELPVTLGTNKTTGNKEDNRNTLFIDFAPPPEHLWVGRCNAL
jgi:hypothetical protein